MAESPTEIVFDYLGYSVGGLFSAENSLLAIGWVGGGAGGCSATFGNGNGAGALGGGVLGEKTAPAVGGTFVHVRGDLCHKNRIRAPLCGAAVGAGPLGNTGVFVFGLPLLGHFGNAAVAHFGGRHYRRCRQARRDIGTGNLTFS